MPALRGPADENRERTYRACVHCRGRKSRCDLESTGEPGKPPCRRCHREGRECVIADSARGGKRTRRTTSVLEDSSIVDASTHAVQANTANANAVTATVASCRPPGGGQQSFSAEESPRYSMHSPKAIWEQWHQTQSPAAHLRQGPERRAPSDQISNVTAPTPLSLEGRIVASNLQNPHDALSILAEVTGEDAERTQQNQRLAMARAKDSERLREPVAQDLDYLPIQQGALSVQTVIDLLRHYKTRYHPFFPIAHIASLNPDNIQTTVNDEPHLLTAILTVASKDDTGLVRAHKTLCAHMQNLISNLIWTGSGHLETVEALLILSEWVPGLHSTIGRGEEDHASWMLCGNAIRLGYLHELDQTAYAVSNNAESSELIYRRRLAWSACFVSDRQISVRVGKAFWSRGPPPLTRVNASDFPTLRSQSSGSDDYALIFQANLELTLLFSNAHDILYSSKRQRDQLFAGGQYVKFLDDFQFAIRTWQSVWSSLSCSPNLKSSLMLSYEYLRLYVNAFAYQATLNRAFARVNSDLPPNEKFQGPQGLLFANAAATPDARFIYEALDAAKSLIGTFNSFIDPVECLRYMPLKYYLYVIYAAVFLFKAEATGALGLQASTSVRRSINETIDRLKRASTNTADMGHRYSCLLRLLWRKASSPSDPEQNTFMAGQRHANDNQGDVEPTTNTMNPLSAFSWRDLDAVGQYVINDDALTSSMGAYDSMGQSFSAFDVFATEGFNHFHDGLAEFTF